ncbi:MAG: class I SAM-dependent methyltransferase [Dehalococcoidia bacterium]
MSESIAGRCPVCETDGARKGPRRFLRCPACGVLFARDMRAGDEAWYQRTWIYAGGRAPNALSALEIEANWAWGTFLREAPVPRGALLDVGCGRGDFLHAAQLRGFDAEGIDFQAELAGIGREMYGVRIACGDIWQALGNGRRFDVATAFEVVEHVADPVGLLRAMARVAGFVAVSVPSAERRPALLSPGFDDPPHHLTLWTRAALEIAMTNAGLEVVFLRGDSYEPSHLGTYVSCLFGGNYAGARYVRGAARRFGTAIGRALRPGDDAPFTLLAVGRHHEVRAGRNGAS